MKKDIKKNIELLVPPGWNDMELMDFLHESNLIEQESSMEALEDAILAWNYAYKHREKIDLDYLLEVHRNLGRRILPKIAGKWRDCSVWIGSDYKPFISEGLIKAQMDGWLRETKITPTKKKWTEQRKEDETRKWHVKYEKVHPHVDGNGRCGRIMMNIHRLLLGLPLLVIDHKLRHETYYPWFRDSDED
jgi:fido (protein-threonine AMPylation protein)